MFRPVIFLLALALTSSVGAGEGAYHSELPGWIQAQMAPKAVPPSVADTAAMKSDSQSWAELIDETWGEGLSTGEKLFFFDTFWHAVDDEFACFQDLDVDWSALRDLYRPEVVSGVSKGRFAAIMSRLSLALMDAHTVALDRVVFWRTAPAPGVPLLMVGGWGYLREFGACLTPLPDRSLLVYKALEDHPLDLAPGDIITGYESRAWAELYPEMLEHGLPVSGFWGSSDETYEHAWLMSAGANWHLFDTIDIKRHVSGEIDHLSTSLMAGYNEQLWCTEQFPVAGVAMPDFNHEQLFSWGVIEGTKIGYIYGWGWAWDAEREFQEAVEALMTEHETEGLIIDFRFNMGGNMHLSNSGLALLFDRVVPTIDWVTRCHPDLHLALCEEEIWPSYVIPGDPETGYDEPIAVLVGPGSVSSGDQVALRMKFHPKARFFGKSTNTAFNAAALLYSDDEWRATYAVADAYLLSNPGEYLTHDPLEVDHAVWLTPDDVAEGRDTVVEAAVEWIRGFRFAPRTVTGRVSPP
jgi:hypothetical protein